MSSKIYQLLKKKKIALNFPQTEINSQAKNTPSSESNQMEFTYKLVSLQRNKGTTLNCKTTACRLDSHHRKSTPVKIIPDSASLNCILSYDCLGLR